MMTQEMSKHVKEIKQLIKPEVCLTQPFFIPFLRNYVTYTENTRGLIRK